MGRAKRNITPEQKLVANRAKSRRHYEKDREQINERRRKQYKKTRSAIRAAQGSSDGTYDSDLPKTTNANGEKTAVAKWMEEATRVLSAIEELTENVPARYVERLYQKYVEKRDSQPLQEQVAALGKLRTSILRCESEVLNQEGVGAEYNKVKSVSHDVDTLIKWVDEVYVYSCLDDEELLRAHQNKELLYQYSRL